MDSFVEQIQALSKRVNKLLPNIGTEEATKTSIIMPFFQALGYDIFNPEEFLPEFIADVGIKKGEKVDFAIMRNGQPVILIEAKPSYEKLDKHDSQLFRYFGTTPAKFAILTNGILYRFYTDLEQTNIMDSLPFFEFNLLEPRENQIAELFKFKKNNFDVDDILTTASELKYTGEIQQVLNKEWDNPSDTFVTLLINEVYPGKKTRNVLDKFHVLVKKSLKQFVNDQVNSKLKAALNNSNTEPVQETNLQEVAVAVEEKAIVEETPQIVTTEEEIEGYVTIKLLLKEIVSPERIHHRDNLSYFNVLIDNNIRKWICRLGFNSTNKYIQFNDEVKTTINIESVSEIINHKDKLLEITKRYL
jgi:predicted type IV restriction endonuclease